MITREFNLYLNAGRSIPLTINANQYDQGEQWVFTLYNQNGTQYRPADGAIVGIKSDGLGIMNTATVDSAGRVVVTVTEQMTAAAGKAEFELQIDNNTHGTANFVVLVEKSPIEGAVMSESDISMLESLTTIRPTNTGTTGQVLTKTANGAEWADGGSGGGSVTVDSALSSTSTNPVQNKVINTALNAKANTSSLATVATSGAYADLSGKPSLATVATSGSYSDLSNKPTIPTTSSTITSGGTAPVNSVAVIAYINSLNASDTAY